MTASWELSLGALGLALAVASSLGWAGLDASRKFLVRRIDPLPLVVLLTVGQLPLFAGWAGFDGRFVHDIGYVAPGLASVGLNIAANLLFMRAVKVSPLSLTIPLLAFVPVFTVVIADPLLGELPSVVQLSGIGAVVLGALVLNAGSATGLGPVALVRALLRERGSLPMLGVALSWAGTIVVDKLATAHASVPAHGFLLNAGVAAVLLTWLAVRRDLGRLSQLRRAPAAGLLAIAFATFALGSQLLAMQHLYVANLEAIKRAIGLMSSVVFGRLLFAEPITVSKLSAVVFMAVGTALVVLDPAAWSGLL